MTDIILLWGCLQLNILITQSQFAWFLVTKWICDDGGEFHMICQEGEDLLVKGQCLITYIWLVICLLSFVQESVGSSWLMWVSFWDSGQLCFWAHRNKGQALDHVEFINSLPSCEEVFSCPLVFSRKYSDILLCTMPLSWPFFLFSSCH